LYKLEITNYLEIDAEQLFIFTLSNQIKYTFIATRTTLFGQITAKGVYPKGFV